MNSYFKALLFCLIGAFPSVTTAQSWEQGTNTEGINMQAIHHHDNSVFSGGATGTYRSSDGGATYTEANNGNTSFGPTRGFAHDATYLYMCSSNGVFRSDDAGASWSSVDSGLPQLLSHGMAASSDRIWVVTTSGAHTSIDHGDNWESAGLEGLDVRCITIMDDIAYAGTQGEGLFRSGDNGENWEAINNGSSSATYRAIEAHGSALFAAGEIGTGIFRSTDEGTNWTLLSGGLPGGTFRGFATLDGWIVAGSFGNGVYISSDNGDNWTGLNDGLGDLTIFDVDFSDSHLLVATDEAGAWRLPIADLPAISNIAEVPLNIALPFPNPSAGRFHFPTAPRNSDFQAWDTQGKQVFQGQLTEQILDVSNWPTGRYLIQVDSGKKQAIQVVHP